MSLFNLLLKIGNDILNKPNSTAAQITNFALKNPNLVKQGENLIGDIFKELTFISFIFFNKINADRQIRTDYNVWKKTPNTSEKARQKKVFKEMSSFIGSRIKKEMPLDVGLERGFISRENPNETIVGIYGNGGIQYAEKVSYNTIDPELDKDLNRNKLVLT